MITLTEIRNKLEDQNIDLIFFDVRNINFWVEKYPLVFPKFIRDKNFRIEVEFKDDSLEYVFYSKDGINFLSVFNEKIKRIKNNIKENLSKIEPIPHEKFGKFLKIVHFKDITDSWSPDYLLGESESLKFLSEKLIYMIDKGDNDNINPLIKRILKNQLKAYDGERGHFSWNHQAVTLKEKELESLRKFFEH